MIIEKELEKRNLPDVLTLGGKKITDSTTWEKELRPYWTERLLTEEYGQMPPVVQPEIKTELQSVDFAGKASWETVTFTFTHNGKTHSVPTQLIAPKGKTNMPFFIYVNFRGDIPDRYLPVEEIIDNGFGVFSVCYHDVTIDNPDFTNGLAGLFSCEPRKADEAGKIVYWSYMAQRMMDYLQTRPEANPNAIGISGHSRLGKTALLTAALDTRFAFVGVNNSGCSGAAISRYSNLQGEHLRDICRNFSYWFCPNYVKYADNEENLPFDQHCLVALVAPRLVCIGAAVEDVWADTDNQFLAGVAASPVWELYGEKGMICEDRMPEVGDEWLDGNVGFHLREGKHYQSRFDWQMYMKAATRYVTK